MGGAVVGGLWHCTSDVLLMAALYFFPHGLYPPSLVYSGHQPLDPSQQTAAWPPSPWRASNLMWELFLLEAPRKNIYVHGHWMGKADLRYIFEDGKFEFHFGSTS